MCIHRPYWKCPRCGLELSLHEVCQGGGHTCQSDQQEGVLIQESLLNATVESMDWMVKDLKWRHEQTGIPGNYSDELRKAIDTLDQLKAEQAKL